MEPQFKICLDGVYVQQDSPLLSGWEKITKPEQLIGYAGDMLQRQSPKAGVSWQGSKIPMSVMAPVLGTIQAFPNMETGYQLYYSLKEGKWRIRCPKQFGLSAAVFFENDVPMQDGFFLQGTIHTHPNMQAFWSGMDLDSNAGRFGLHMVFGLERGMIQSQKITIFTKINHYDLALSDIFEDDVDLQSACKPNPEWVEAISQQFQPDFELVVDGRKYGPHQKSGTKYDQSTAKKQQKRKKEGSSKSPFQQLLVEKYGYDAEDLADWIGEDVNDGMENPEQWMIYNQCEDGDWTDGIMASATIRAFMDDSSTIFKHDFKPKVTPPEAELAAVLNRKFRGTGWVEAAHSAQNLDDYEEDLRVIFQYLDETMLMMMLEDFRDQVDIYNEVCEGVKFGGRLLAPSAFQWADAVLSNAPDIPGVLSLEHHLRMCADTYGNLSWRTLAMLIVSLETTQMTVVHLWELYQRMAKEGRLKEC